jgi:hypothetical protein
MGTSLRRRRMETALIAGLVAGVISLLGLLVNIHLARQSRIATEKNLRDKLLLDVSAEGEGKLREFIAQGERVRIRCWEMMGQFTMLADSPSESGINLEAFQTSASSLHQQTNLFLDSWSDVKASLPEGISRHCRTLRHECRTELENIVLNCRRACDLVQQNSPEAERLAAIVGNARLSLTVVLQKLDELISVVCGIRRKVLSEIAEGTQ